MEPDVVGADVRVREHDDTHAAHLVEPCKRAVTARAAVVPDNRGSARPGEYVPRQADRHRRAAGGTARHVCLPQRAGQRVGTGIEIRREECQQIGRRGTQCAGPGECREIPIGHDVPLGVVTGGEPHAQGGGQRDRGFAHPQGRENALPHQLLVAHPGLARERVSQETHTEIRILVCLAHVAGQLVARQEGVQLLDRVIGVRVGRVARRQVRREAGQAGRLGRQVDERDLAAIACGDPHRCRQILRDWIVEADRAVRHHRCKNRRREGLGDGADLEHAVFGNPHRHHAAPAVSVEQAHDDAAKRRRAQPFLEDPFDGGIGR